MTQDIVNKDQSISYTNLDFSSIYTEVLDLIKQLTYRWDPSISDESDPGVILVKLSALIADKCNYNIDKSILEAFPLSVTQPGNARQLYEQLGYYMHWYRASTTSVVMSYSQTSGYEENIISYTIPKFTHIVDSVDEKIIYSLIGVSGPDGVIVSDGTITTDGKDFKMVAMSGIAKQYAYSGNEIVITSQMVDKNTCRLYFPDYAVAENGVFITNTNQNNFADWKRVDNLYEQTFNELRYRFGYDDYSNQCYLEFPDNYAELFGDGIEITYLVLDDTVDYKDIPAQTLDKFLSPITPKEDLGMLLNSSNVSINNYTASYGYEDIESIDDAYYNYKKIVGTFKTLITLRDYLNYIKSDELDLCSNAFVCDRTNDVQSSYKIVSKQHDLDSIIVKVEQVLDKTDTTFNFDYNFKKTLDTEPISGKVYYEITNYNRLITHTSVTAGTNPKQMGWYEMSYYTPVYKDALEPFSLKFYLLKNGISLNAKDAFNQTFEMSDETLDIDTIIDETSHLEHQYEEILPLGKDSYKMTEDTVYLANKSYYDANYELLHNYTVGDTIPVDPVSQLPVNTYELDFEALLPHTILFKNVYPLTINIFTYDKHNGKTQEDIIRNVISSLQAGLNSSQLNFGDDINMEYLTELVVSSDIRIKTATFESFSYLTKATYFDGNDFVTISLPQSLDELDDYFGENGYKELDKIIGKKIAKDIVCKSILCGSTSLLLPDEVFKFHLKHAFKNYYENISSITTQAVIDFNGDDIVTTYSSDSNNPMVRQSYLLKPNETLTFYRPQLESLREFTAGIHYEYYIGSNIQAGQSYELKRGEYIIFYQSYYSDSNSANVGTPDGFNIFACTKGVIINPSFDIKAYAESDGMTQCSSALVKSYFDENPDDNWYEVSTYLKSYVTEVYNNSKVRNNGISGNDFIKLQSLRAVEIQASDNYKFFWVLKTPEYSGKNKDIKTYTLFDKYDVATNLSDDKNINMYTLKSGEYLYYVDSDKANLVVMGAGTTICRDCGVESYEFTNEPEYKFSYANINDFNTINPDAQIRFKSGSIEKITSMNPETGKHEVNPYLNGWYERSGTDPDYTYTRTPDTTIEINQGVPKDYYVLVQDDNSGLYEYINETTPPALTTLSSEVFSEVFPPLSNINPSEQGWYEAVSVSNSYVSDNYALSDGKEYGDYKRYTTTDDNILLSRHIFNDIDYSDIDISNVDTYKDVDINKNNSNNFNPVILKLTQPTDSLISYKTYYSDNIGTVVENINYLLDNPSEQGWYEYIENDYVLSLDDRPQILSTDNTLSYVNDISSDLCFEEVLPNNDLINFRENGYYYRKTLNDTTYIFDRDRTNIWFNVGFNVFDDLLNIYKSHSEESSATRTIDSIIDDYNIISKSGGRKCPIKTFSNKFGWRTPAFTTYSSAQDKYYGIGNLDFQNLINSSVSKAEYKVYPAANSDLFTVIISQSDSVDTWISEQSISVTELEMTNSFIQMFDRENSSDGDIKTYLNKLYSTFNGRLSGITLGIDYALNIYKFRDLYKFSDKSYYIPNRYVTKTFEKINSWTCEALDNNELAKDPINSIKDLWQQIQPNTSLRIISNEMWSFGEGDTIRLEAPVFSTNAVVWPVFKNKETTLNLDSYSIWYRRNGESIESLNNLYIQGYDWQGYSQLLLNTSYEDGQKLESNHSITLYGPDDNGLNEIKGIINGSEYSNATIQLKTPINNKAGRYIDTTYTDINGNVIVNSLYEFVPEVSTDDYTYVSDNNTYVKFKLNEDGTIVDRTVEVPLKLPKGKYILPVYASSDFISYNASMYLKARCSDAHDEVEYCINAIPIPDNSNTQKTIRISTLGYTDTSRSNDTSYGEQLFTYSKDKLISYGGEEYNMYGTDYNYLDVNISTNPILHTDNNPNYVQVKLPAYLSELYSTSPNNYTPIKFGWYELNDNGEYVLSENTDYGSDLLEEIIQPTITDNGIEEYSYWKENINPNLNRWYERIDEYYILTEDTSPVDNKIYYKDMEFYVPLLYTPVLKFNALSLAPTELAGEDETYVIINDVFKYEENDFGGHFEEIKQKVRDLDIDVEYNYSFIPNKNDEIKNPLDSASFFKSSHPYNAYTIAQLDFDNTDYRYI